MIRFVPLSAVLIIHAELIREFGGQPGIRDHGLLESALDRPKNRHKYDNADLFILAAAYAFGIAKNHPLIDGNKRVGLVCAYSFLQMNGMELSASEEETVIVMTGVASGKVDEKTLASWFKTNCKQV